MKPVVVVEICKLCLTLARNGREGVGKRAFMEMEQTHPRFAALNEAPRVATPTIAKTETTPSTPYAQTSQSDYSGISQLSAEGKACIPCGNDHLSLAAGSLSEAIRFAREGGITHPEVVSRITLAVDDLNAFERIDGAPEKVTKLPPHEKALMDDMMSASREIRHHITDINNPSDLENTAALARQYRIEFMAKQMKMQKGQ